MRSAFFIVFAFVFLAVSFAAFFPDLAIAIYQAAFYNQFWASPSAGNHAAGLSGIDRSYYWILGVTSFLVAFWLFLKAFKR